MALQKLQPVLMFAAQHPEADLSLQALAREARLSPFQLHRMLWWPISPRLRLGL